MPDVSSATASRSKIFDSVRFYVTLQVPERSKLQGLIRDHGGALAPQERAADVILVKAGHSSAANYVYTKPEYVHDSIAQGQRLDPANYRADTITGPQRVPGRAIAGKKTTRAKFTPQEDRILFDWVTAQERAGGKIKGNKIYEELARRHPEHTLQSWRSRWVEIVSKHDPARYASNTTTAPVSRMDGTSLVTSTQEPFSSNVSLAPLNAASHARPNVVANSTVDPRQSPNHLHGRGSRNDQATEMQNGVGHQSSGRRRSLSAERVDTRGNERTSLDVPTTPVTPARRRSLELTGSVRRALEASAFTDEDANMLFFAVPTIENTSPERRKEAWEEFAAAWTDHTKQEWKRFYHLTIRKMYMQQNDLKTEDDLRDYVRQVLAKEAAATSSEERTEEDLQASPSQRNKSPQVNGGDSRDGFNDESRGSPEIPDMPINQDPEAAEGHQEVRVETPEQRMLSRSTSLSSVHGARSALSSKEQSSRLPTLLAHVDTRSAAEKQRAAERERARAEQEDLEFSEASDIEAAAEAAPSFLTNQGEIQGNSKIAATVAGSKPSTEPSTQGTEDSQDDLTASPESQHPVNAAVTKPSTQSLFQTQATYDPPPLPPQDTENTQIKASSLSQPESQPNRRTFGNAVSANQPSQPSTSINLPIEMLPPANTVMNQPSINGTSKKADNNSQPIGSHESSQLETSTQLMFPATGSSHTTSTASSVPSAFKPPPSFQQPRQPSPSQDEPPSSPNDAGPATDEARHSSRAHSPDLPDHPVTGESSNGRVLEHDVPGRNGIAAHSLMDSVKTIETPVSTMEEPADSSPKQSVPQQQSARETQYHDDDQSPEDEPPDQNKDGSAIPPLENTISQLNDTQDIDGRQVELVDGDDEDVLSQASDGSTSSVMMVWENPNESVDELATSNDDPYDIPFLQTAPVQAGSQPNEQFGASEEGPLEYYETAPQYLPHDTEPDGHIEAWDPSGKRQEQDAVLLDSGESAQHSGVARKHARRSKGWTESVWTEDVSGDLSIHELPEPEEGWDTQYASNDYDAENIPVSSIEMDEPVKVPGSASPQSDRTESEIEQIEAVPAQASVSFEEQVEVEGPAFDHDKSQRTTDGEDDEMPARAGPSSSINPRKRRRSSSATIESRSDTGSVDGAERRPATRHKPNTTTEEADSDFHEDEAVHVKLRAFTATEDQRYPNIPPQIRRTFQLVAFERTTGDMKLAAEVMAAFVESYRRLKQSMRAKHVQDVQRGLAHGPFLPRTTISAEIAKQWIPQNRRGVWTNSDIDLLVSKTSDSVASVRKKHGVINAKKQRYWILFAHVDYKKNE